MEQHPGTYIVHGIPADSTSGSLENNLCIDKSKNQTWKDFLAIVLEHTPTLSCSSVTSTSAPIEMYSRVGVILKNGKVLNARSKDGISVTYSPDVKLMLGDNGETLQERVTTAITNKRGRYNELIVGEPEVEGLYFSDGVSHLGGNMVSNQPFLQSEAETNAAIRELAQISLARNLPLYKFKQGSGFVQVNPRKYIEQTKAVA